MSARKKYEPQILKKIRELPMEKMVETLDFVTFLDDQEKLLILWRHHRCLR